MDTTTTVMKLPQAHPIEILLEHMFSENHPCSHGARWQESARLSTIERTFSFNSYYLTILQRAIKLTPRNVPIARLTVNLKVDKSELVNSKWVLKGKVFRMTIHHHLRNINFQFEPLRRFLHGIIFFSIRLYNFCKLLTFNWSHGVSQMSRVLQILRIVYLLPLAAAPRLGSFCFNSRTTTEGIRFFVGCITRKQYLSKDRTQPVRLHVKYFFELLLLFSSAK